LPTLINMSTTYWRMSPTTADQHGKQPIKITHPFSPHRGQEYIFVDIKHVWGEDRIICCDENGNSRSFLASWTDYPSPNHYYNTKECSVDFYFDDLQILAKLIAAIKMK